METTFDPAKDATNLEKHGVSLALVSEMVWDEAIERMDDRKNYGEIRMIATAPIKNRLFVVVYTNRGDTRRIISLRKANDREVRDYANQI